MNLKRIQLVALLPILMNALSVTWAHGDDYELLHNPFVHPPLSAVATTATIADRIGRQRPDLRATLVAGKDSMVNVGGKLLSIGDEVDGYRLISVSEGRAVFERNTEQIIVLVSGNQGNSDD